MLYEAEREKLCKIMKLMFQRKLTNAAGGNAAMRVAEGVILVTPSMMSEHQHCDITPQDILVCDYDLNIIEGERVPSRECRMHAKILCNMPEVGGVIHAHPEYTMIYVAANRPVPTMTEATEKIGACGIVEQAKAYSSDLADHVYDYFADKRELLKTRGMCAILPYHGTVALGIHIEQAFSYIERVECDAKCSLFGKLLE